jgi:hypothetical protein
MVGIKTSVWQVYTWYHLMSPRGCNWYKVVGGHTSVVGSLISVLIPDAGLLYTGQILGSHNHPVPQFPWLEILHNVLNFLKICSFLKEFSLFFL